MINYDLCRYYTDVSLFPVDASARWGCIETAAADKFVLSRDGIEFDILSLAFGGFAIARTGGRLRVITGSMTHGRDRDLFFN